MEASPLWAALTRAARRADRGKLRLWEWLRDTLDLAQYRPRPAQGVVARELRGRQGIYYVLKNQASKTYYRLGERDHYLWQLMDGRKSVKDLVVAYFVQYGSFAFSRVATLVEGLKANLLLSEKPVNVYQQLQGRLARRSLSYRFERIWNAFQEKQFAVHGLDGALTSIYRTVGWLFYTRPMQAVYLIATVAGLYCFLQSYRTGEFGVVTVRGSYLLGIVSLLVANLLSIFVHEMAHALTVKRYGREVRRGGFMIYFGMPAFFVDTTDIWMENKGPRLAVTSAGPYSGLILGGLASIVIFLRPAWEISALLFEFAFVAYLTVFINLNPLLELDGYYALMDWLEIPMLRGRSLEFVRKGLWQKMSGIAHAWEGPANAIASFSTEERIFAVFGLLSAGWTFYAIYAAVGFYQGSLSGATANLWSQGNSVGRFALALVGLVIALAFALSMGMYLLNLGSQALNLAARRGLFSTTWRVAGVLFATIVALLVAPSRLGYPALLPLIALAALGAAGFWAWRNAILSACSRLSRVFWLLGLAALALLLHEAGTQLAVHSLFSSRLLGLLSIAAGCIAYVDLLLAALLLFAHSRLKGLYRAEKLLLALGWAVCCVPYALLVQRFRLTILPSTIASLASLLSLTLLIPTVFSFWQTHFGPAWLMLAFALGGLAAAPLLGLPIVLPCLLLAASLLLHYLAYSRAAELPERPEAETELNDGNRLRRAFAWTIEAVLAQLRDTSGERRTQEVVRRFNHYALAAAWHVQVMSDRVRDSLAIDVSVIDRGKTYAAGLTLFLDLIAEEIGQNLTQRALQRAYDVLPWEEREVAAQYLFPDVAQAAVLSHQFQYTSQDYRSLLRRMPLFSTMDEVEINLLRSRLREAHYPAGQVIIRQGERGEQFFIIRQGRVEVTARDEQGAPTVVNRLDRGDYFGEIALLRDMPRTATCRAIIPTDVLTLSRPDFDGLVKARFALREKVDRTIASTDLLRSMPIFAELGAQHLQLIVSQMQEEIFEPGAAIIRQGEIGETFYVIESGRVQVSVTQDGEEKVVSERGPGEYVGEIALLLEVPRTATVTALTPVQALTLRKRDFDRLVAKHLYVSRRLLHLRQAAKAEG